MLLQAAQDVILESFREIELAIAPELPRVAYVGTREYPYQLVDWVHQAVVLVHEANAQAIFVSGRSPGGGPDVWGEWAADFMCKPRMAKQIFPINRKAHGSRAPWVRNGQIADCCDIMISFWNGTSNGTNDVRQKAIKQHKPVITIYPTGRVEKC